MRSKNDTEDPRTKAERRADEEVLARIETGAFLAVVPEREDAARRAVEEAYRTRRRLAATLGSQLGLLRRARGVSQDRLARLIGTKKSNISRIESGRYGGLSIERFLAILQALNELPFEASVERRKRATLIRERSFQRFRTPKDCLESTRS